MPERWRSSAARELAAAVRKAGGTVERTGTGRIRITGPEGTITIHERCEPGPRPYPELLAVIS